jgi:hypothetical protein
LLSSFWPFRRRTQKERKRERERERESGRASLPLGGGLFSFLVPLWKLLFLLLLLLLPLRWLVYYSARLTLASAGRCKVAGRWNLPE